MSSKKIIGGFYRLELPKGNSNIHSNAAFFSTGRACIGFIAKQLKPSKVYVPAFTCDATYDPFLEQGIPIEKYELNAQMLPNEIPTLKSEEFLLLTNYFGLQRSQIKEIINVLGSQVIIDDTHDFFNTGYKKNWSFTSARKHFGIPDGAFLFSPEEDEIDTKELRPFEEITLDPYLWAFLGLQNKGFRAYQDYEARLDSRIALGSKFSERVLSQLDFQEIQKRRQTNFKSLHRELKGSNTYPINSTNPESPFCYPYLAERDIDKSALFAKSIFIPTYWSDVLRRDPGEFEFSKLLTSRLLPLPIDHRYANEDMARLAATIKSL